MFTITFILDEYYLKLKELKDKIPVVDIVKEKIKELRSIDQILEHIIEDEEQFTFIELQIETISMNNILNKEIKIGKYSWMVQKRELEDLINNKSIFYITEREIFIPFSKSIKMMKGIVEERGIKVEIKKEDFENDLIEEDDNKIILNVIPRDDEKYNILLDECKGKLLIILLKDPNYM